MASPASSASKVPLDNQYQVVEAPLCSISKVIRFALVIFSIVAIIALYLYGHSYADYAPIPEGVGGLSILSLLYTYCSKPTPNTLYVKAGERTVYLENVRSENNGHYEVVGDGNCLFHSVVASAKLLGRSDIPQNHMSLRKAVVKWMRDNKDDDVLHNSLGSSLTEHLTAEKNKLVEEQTNLTAIAPKQAAKMPAKIAAIEEQMRAVAEGNFDDLLDNYFDAMSQSRTHGTASEILAINKMYNICISPDGMKFGDPNNGVINLVSGHNHYNFRAPTPAVKK